jgi:hypothetical protein
MGSKTRNAIDYSNTGIVGSNPTRGMSVCVLSIFVLSCAGRGLATGWSPIQGVLPTLCKIHSFTLILNWCRLVSNPSNIEEEACLMQLETAVLTCSGPQSGVKALLSHLVNKLLGLFSVDNKAAIRTAGVPRRGTSCSEIAGRLQEEVEAGCTRSRQPISCSGTVTNFACFNYPQIVFLHQRLCGLLVRVSGYSSTGSGLDSRRFQVFSEAAGLERGPLSLVMTTEELLEGKVAGPV